MMNKSIVAVAILFSIVMSACQTHEMQPAQGSSNSGSTDKAVPNLFEDKTTNEKSSEIHHHAVVKEVLQDGKYSFVRVSGDEVDRWLITASVEVVEGDHINYKEGLVKRGYKSTSLDRVFEEVTLVSSFSVAQTNAGANHGVLTTSEFLSQASELEGQIVRVKGVVAKVNANIMNRHWVHLSESLNGTTDVVVTTQTILPVGHEVVYEGEVVLDKDFGAGYVFKILIENGVAL